MQATQTCNETSEHTTEHTIDTIVMMTHDGGMRQYHRMESSIKLIH